MNNRYRVERLPNGMIRVFDVASKLSACYTADGTYRHGDLHAATLDALLAAAGVRPAARDYFILPRASASQR